MSSTEEYVIICFIPRSKDAFSVNIEKSRPVDQLKDMIKAKKPQTFVNVEADTLSLYQVTIYGSLTTEQFIDQLNRLSQNLNESMRLWGGRELSSYFSESPAPPGKYYVIVQLPEGEPAIKTTVWCSR